CGPRRRGQRTDRKKAGEEAWHNKRERQSHSAQHVPLLRLGGKAADHNKPTIGGPEQVLQNGRMPLPIKPLPLVERWDCHQCGACCRGSLVPLSADDLARPKSQKWDARPEYKNTPVSVRDSWLSSHFRLAHREDGSCVFLLPDGMCRIHKELGF